MSFPLVRFVEGPDPAAAVRFDLNTKAATTKKVLGDGFTLGVPTLEGDPHAPGVVYGDRQPMFSHIVSGTKADALAALSSLSRELLRPTNWVLFQLDAFTAPIWLRTYRSQFGALSLDQVYVETETGDSVALPDTWRIPVPLLADAFAYGERVTLPAVKVVQSATGDRAMRWVLPEIEGDAPTPLRVQIAPPSGYPAYYRPEYLIGCTAGDSAMSDPVVGIGTADGHTGANGIGAGVSDANYFGGSYREVDFATVTTPTLLRRLSGNMPAVWRKHQSVVTVYLFIII